MRPEGGFRTIGQVAAGFVAVAALRRAEGVMGEREARAALVETAVAAMACEAIPAAQEIMRSRIGGIADGLRMDKDDSLHGLRNACWDWAKDAGAWPRVVAALRDLYLARAQRHLDRVGG